MGTRWLCGEGTSWGPGSWAGAGGLSSRGLAFWEEREVVVQGQEARRQGRSATGATRCQGPAHPRPRRPVGAARQLQGAAEAQRGRWLAQRPRAAEQRRWGSPASRVCAATAVLSAASHSGLGGVTRSGAGGGG